MFQKCINHHMRYSYRIRNALRAPGDTADDGAHLHPLARSYSHLGERLPLVIISRTSALDKASIRGLHEYFPRRGKFRIKTFIRKEESAVVRSTNISIRG